MHVHHRLWNFLYYTHDLSTRSSLALRLPSRHRFQHRRRRKDTATCKRRGDNDYDQPPSGAPRPHWAWLSWMGLRILGLRRCSVGDWRTKIYSKVSYCRTPWPIPNRGNQPIALKFTELLYAYYIVLYHTIVQLLIAILINLLLLLVWFASYMIHILLIVLNKLE